ncbi:MAG: GNAT family N-acetyltransferase [Bacillota bacterium]
MPTIQLKKVTVDNFDKVVALSKTLTEAQQKCVAPNMVSLAEAYVEPDRAWPRAIYLDDEPIGFIMLALHEDEVPKEDWPAYYLWRFMIAKAYQGKGYGTKVLDMIIEKCKRDKQAYLYTSCDMEGDQPYLFYINYGFIDTGKNDGEQILKLPIK